MKETIVGFSKKILRHELITGSFYLFIGTILSAGLAFLLNIFFARSLSKPDYGVYASLLALITLFIIPAQSLTPIVVKFIADYFAKGEMDKLRKFYLKMSKFAIIFSMGIFLLLLIFSPLVNRFLNLDNPFYIPLAGLVTATSYIAIVNSGTLQGMLKFKFISFSQITGALLRVLAGVILVLLGFKVFGAVWGSFFSFFSIYILGFIPLRFLFRKTKDKEVTVNIREFAKYAIPSTITILSLSSFISVDVILVKHFFPPLQAGLYGGLSLIGKVIFYFTGPIPIALFPLVVKRHLKNENYKKLFLLALLLVLLPSVAISAFYLIYPLFTTQLFLGDEYVAIVPYLGLFGIYIGAFSLLNVSVSFYLSLKKNLIFIPVLLGSILQIILITLFHANFYEIIFVSLGIVGLLLFGFLLSFLKSFKL